MTLIEIGRDAKILRNHQHKPGDFVLHRDSIVDVMNAVQILEKTWRVVRDTESLVDVIELVPTYLVVDINNDRVNDVLDSDDLIPCDVLPDVRKIWWDICTGNAPRMTGEEFGIYPKVIFRSELE